MMRWFWRSQATQVASMFDDRGFGKEEFAGDGVIVESAGRCIEPSNSLMLSSSPPMPEATEDGNRTVEQVDVADMFPSLSILLSC